MWSVSESTHFLIVIDEDRRQFTVEGPLCDAQPWSRAMDKAREDGRKIKCCDIGSASRAEAVAEWQRHYGHFYRLVEPGRIVSPQSESHREARSERGRRSPEIRTAS